MSRRIALVTGATSGIGEATARLMALNGFDLIITGRREEKLLSLKNDLSNKAMVVTLNFDVRDKEEVKNKIEGLPAEWKSIDVLINNAGNAHGLDPIQRGSLEDWDAMIDINVKGLLYVSREVIPLMVEKKAGHIINIGSIAGKEVYPNGNVYCASKFGVDALTKGMRMDLNPYGIKVTSINPGLVETEFSLVRFKGDAPKASQVYKGLDPLKAEDIADIILYTLNAPSHVVLADITVLPTAQASAAIVKRKE
jgi:3-hydroxy acid dehydrogenase / malonic semialdehyde reductase